MADGPLPAADPTTTNNDDNETLFTSDQIRSIVEKAVFASLVRLCGDGVVCSRPDTSHAANSAAAVLHCPSDWHETLHDLAVRSVSFPNGTNDRGKENGKGGGGKPHDVEVRVALSLYNRYAPRQQSRKSKNTGRKRLRRDAKQDDIEKRTGDIGTTSSIQDSLQSSTSQPPLEIVSDLGLRRPIHSASDLAKLIALDMEQSSNTELQQSIHNQDTTAEATIPTLRELCDDVRPAATSGIICLVTKSRVRELRKSGKLPCPLCTKWCKGEKGLWWHRQMEHGADHGTATQDASDAVDTLALVVYDPSVGGRLPTQCLAADSLLATPNDSADDEAASDDGPFAHAKNGDLAKLIQSFESTGLDPATATDRNGSSCLHWAAGGGHLHVVEYLVKSRSGCPNIGQEGKRSFRGRTALHWAARNGHVDVVRYLVEECNADMEAVTADGTTAFCWACWQGHSDCVKYLHSRGCNTNSKNSFGCNATLWAAQGEGGLDIIQWLSSIGCNLDLINSNGHGVLHKSAQRNKRHVIEFILDRGYQQTDLSLIGPDLEEHCPSDLAGMEGHLALAEWLAEKEKELALRLFCPSQLQVPSWLEKGVQEAKSESKLMVSLNEYMNVWEAGGGIKRMSCHILLQNGASLFINEINVLSK